MKYQAVFSGKIFGVIKIYIYAQSYCPTSSRKLISEEWINCQRRQLSKLFFSLPSERGSTLKERKFLAKECAQYW